LICNGYSELPVDLQMLMNFKREYMLRKPVRKIADKGWNFAVVGRPTQSVGKIVFSRKDA